MWPAMKWRDATIKPSGLAAMQRMIARAGVAAKRARRDFLSGILLRYVAPANEGRLRRMVTKALALAPRGFVPNDVLVLRELSASMRLEWRTRDIHPWDRDLPATRRADRFRHQTLSDTDATIERLFRILPELNTIEVRVLEPQPPHRLILAGTVTRADVVATRAISSPDMRLRMMGIAYGTRY